MSAVKNYFSKWLLRKLDEKGWSQAELSYNAGVSRTAISDVISEKRSAGVELCRAIAHALRLPPEEVFREAGLLPPKKPLAVREEKINYKVSLLLEPEQERVLEFVDFLLERSERNERADKPKEVESTQ